MQLSKTQIIALFLASNASAQIAEGSRGFKWDTVNTKGDVGNKSTGFVGLTFNSKTQSSGGDMGVAGSFESGGVANCKENIERSGGSAITKGSYMKNGSALSDNFFFKGDRETGTNFRFENGGYYYSGVMANGVILKGNYANKDGTQEGTFTMSTDGCPVNVTVTLADIMNGSSVKETVSAKTNALIELPLPKASFTKVNTLATCEGRCGDTPDTETCAAMQMKGVSLEDTKSYCVINKVCGTLGKINNVPFHLNCWEADSNTQPALSEVETLFNNVELIITKDGAGSWTDVRHVKVPSSQNYMTGWWTRDDNTSATGIWTETDKPVNNICNANADCTAKADQCCATWPDTNNKRCMDKKLEGVEQTILPFEKWQPACAAAGNGPPISGKTDLADDAIAKAVEKLGEFRESLATDAKKAQGYDTMSEADRKKYDETAAKAKADRDILIAELRLDAGIDGADCDKNCETVYNDELLKWEKAVFLSCQANDKSIECIDFVKIKKATEKARKTDGFYTGDAANRTTLGLKEVEETKKTKSTLTAAWLKTNKPAAGKVGSACSATEACTTETHCCGTATPKKVANVEAYDKIEGICADKKLGTYTDGLKRDYTHECGAKALLASATAVFAAVFLM